MASREPKPAAARPAGAPADVDDDLPPWVGCACCSVLVGVLAILMALSYRFMPAPDAFDKTRVVQFKGDAALRTVVWPGAGRATTYGPNGQDTDWAIFFYKPYCPACRRVWPIFRALGNTVNSSKLRFGEVDCVKERGVCSLLGAEKHPLIRIYKIAPSQVGKSSGWKRESVAEWQGLLIHYEIMQWFVDQQGSRVIHSDVTWPSADLLASEMRAIKATGRTSHESSMAQRPHDPSGYLVDAELALVFGLIDHVIVGAPAGTTSPPTLEGERLLQLLKWVSLQQEIFPRAAVRAKLEVLFHRLQQRHRWTSTSYEAELQAVGFDTKPVDDRAWRWCAPLNPSSEGIATSGGYTCGLWLLFHTTLANSDRLTAPAVLSNIRDWVGNFFGCSYCSAHFVKYYDEHEGALVRDHISAVLWLWEAHNAVSMRLNRQEHAASDSDKGGRPHVVWPTLEMCRLCYKEEARGEDGKTEIADTTGGVQDPWDLHNVFEYHQEVFCFESDTFVCSGFDDTSRDQELRQQYRDGTLSQPDEVSTDK